MKRRSAARELCDSGRVLVNGKPSKPGKEVRAGDRITLLFSTRAVEVEVLSLAISAGKKDRLQTMFSIISEQQTGEGHL